MKVYLLLFLLGKLILVEPLSYSREECARRRADLINANGEVVLNGRILAGVTIDCIGLPASVKPPELDGFNQDPKQ